MKKYVMMAVCAVLVLASCGGDKGGEIKLDGEWKIKSYVPLELSSYNLVDTEGDYRFEFDGEGSFFCGTDCNSISGIYVSEGDSLRFKNMMSTEMACDNERLERAMKQALPAVRTAELSSDSVLTMKSAGGEVLVALVKVK